MSHRKTLLTLALFPLLTYLIGCDAIGTPYPTAARSSPSPTLEAAVMATPTTDPTAPPRRSPTALPFPPRPEDLADYPPAIVTYLNDTAGDVDGLRAMLEGWETLADVTDLLRVDVDDDGEGELLLIIVGPSEEYVVNRTGDLLVIDIHAEKYALAYQATGDSLLTDPALLEVDDINSDGHTELAFTSTSCGAHTCYTRVHIVASGKGTYKDLTDGGIEMSYVEPRLSDWDNDGVLELMMYGGTIGSIGAGPQRARTEIYRWDATKYALSETIYDPSNYLYFKVLDANQALLDGELERAATLYEEAIQNPNLQVWMEENEREELTSFSRYRLSLTHLLAGDIDSAQVLQDELLAQLPDSVYAQVVAVLWDTYLRDGDLRTACEDVGTFAAAHPETAGMLSDYGYGNPTFTSEEVCPLTLF